MPGPYPLQTLSVEILENGISSPPYEDILASLQASYRSIYGADIDLAADTQDGQWIAIHAQAIYDMNQALIAGFFSYSPNFAVGVGLSSVVKINGIARLTPSPSTADLLIVGQAGKLILDGVASDGFGNSWYLPRRVVIPITGEITVTGISLAPGSIRAEPDTITTIATPVPGWQSVTNPKAAFPGMPVETDATLRMRQKRSTALLAVTPMEGIDGGVAQVHGVGRSKVYQNDTPYSDDDGIPPHSIAVIVEGGNVQQLGAVIQRKKNIGSGTYGDTSVTVEDSRGVPMIVNFFYLAQVQIYVTITLEPLPSFVDTTETMIFNAIAQYINWLDIGEDVYRARLFTPAGLSGDAAIYSNMMPQGALDRFAESYILRDVRLGTEADPTRTTDITIPFNSAAVSTVENVKILIVLARHATLKIIETDDTLAGQAALGPIHIGTLNVTEALDTISAQIRAITAGRLVRTQIPDELSATGRTGPLTLLRTPDEDV